MSALLDVTDHRSALASVVGDVDRFLSESFGLSPWLGSSNTLVDLFGIDDVDAIVCTAVRTPAIRMVNNGRSLSPAKFCSPSRIGGSTLTDTADAAKVLDQYRRGATLVLQSLQRTWPPLADWCGALERDLGWPVQANVYLTPPDQRGLSRHADNHDVFAIQLHGSKHWQVEGLPDGPSLPGDVRYIPAGTPHEASTVDDRSLHLTIGVHRPVETRVVRAAVDIARERIAPQTGAATGIRSLASELAKVEVDEAIDRLRRPSRRAAFGYLAESVRRPPIGNGSRLLVADGWRLEQLPEQRPDSDTIVLCWQGGRLRLPSRTFPALKQLNEAGGQAITVGDLQGLTGDEQLVLSRRLLDEGAAVLHVDG